MKDKYYTPTIEIWKDVIDYEDEYEVSNLGNVRRKSKNLKQAISKCGYNHLTLSKGGIGKTQLVHRLVAKSFLPNPDNKEQVNHIDCDKINNSKENLEWVTHQENISHAVENELQRNQNGEKNNMSKLTEKDVLFIREMLEDGLTAYSIHRDYYPELHLQTIYGIKQRRLWKKI